MKQSSPSNRLHSEGAIYTNAEKKVKEIINDLSELDDDIVKQNRPTKNT